MEENVVVTEEVNEFDSQVNLLELKKPKSFDMEDLEMVFNYAKEHDYQYVSVMIDIAGYARPETIINPSVNFDQKLAYYKENYREDCFHKAVKMKIVRATCSNGLWTDGDLKFIEDIRAEVK